MDGFIVAFNAVVPIFLMIVLGYIVKRLGIVNQDFVNQSTKFVFRVSLPSMIFMKVSSIELEHGIELSQLYLMIFCAVSIIIAYVLSRALGKVLIKKSPDTKGYTEGSFVQGSFRSNYLIIGYPVLLNLFGDEVVLSMALVTLVVIPMFNVLSIIALTPPNNNSGYDKYKQILINIVKNPLIISIALGFIASALSIQLPHILISTITMTGNLATPLALIAIGAFFHFDGFRKTLRNTIGAVVIKLLLLPVIMTLVAYVFGFEPMNIILIAVLFGGPTAVSSFAMSSELNGDPVLAGNIIILSSGLCVLSYMTIISIWLNVLRIA